MHRAETPLTKSSLTGTKTRSSILNIAPTKIDWWFDHHQSAFLSEADKRHFEQDNGGKKFLDTNSKSCAEFIARIAKEQFDFSDETLAELIHWAHISTARFMNRRRSASSFARPLETDAGYRRRKRSAICRKDHPRPDEKSLDEIVESEEFKQIKTDLGASLGNGRIDQTKIGISRGVVTFDLVGMGIDGYNKFIRIISSRKRLKRIAHPKRVQDKDLGRLESVVAAPALHNIAEICERYGGGGHAVVGAVSLKPDEVENGGELCAKSSRNYNSQTKILCNSCLFIKNRVTISCIIK